MSADNYFIIKRHPRGGWAAVMGFASDEEDPKVLDTDRQFETVGLAVHYANQCYTEYGVSLDPEAFEGAW